MQNILKFESNLNIQFKNKSLLIAALTHKSANQEINNSPDGIARYCIANVEINEAEC